MDQNEQRISSKCTAPERDYQPIGNESISICIYHLNEEAIGPLTNKQQQLITALEVIRIEDFISPHVGVGRPREDRLPMARAFIAKAVYGHTTTWQLLDQLQSDVRLRRICG